MSWVVDTNLSGDVDFDDYILIDLGFNHQTETLNSGTMSRWAEIAQMEHFGQRYMEYLITKMAEPGIYLTYEDFFPSAGTGTSGGNAERGSR